MGTDPTQPTPPPAPALPPPEALAPVAAPTEALVLPGGWQIEGLPDIVRRAGPQAAERTVEFFTAQIRNPHTRAAYAAAVTRFFAWCEARGLALAQISPIAVATYIDEMHGRYRAPTIKQHLAAIRRLFDWVDVFRMIKRRIKTVGLGEANCHTFRATGITAYLLNGGTLERAQAIAGHESPRTTKLYDRTADEVTIEDIEKIGI